MSAKNDTALDERGRESRNLELGLDKVLKRLQDGNSGLKTLEQVFDESTNVLDYAARSLGAIDLSAYLHSGRLLSDSLHESIRVLASTLPDILKELTEGCQVLQQEVADPLMKYTADYGKNLSEFARNVRQVLVELSASRQTTENNKDSYFRTASQLEKSQIALKTLIQSIEKGNFSFNSMMNAKTGKSAATSSRRGTEAARGEENSVRDVPEVCGIDKRADKQAQVVLRRAGGVHASP